METRDERGFGTNEDILLVLNDEHVVTYSNAIDIVVSSVCRNKCGYCDFSSKGDDLIVPYSTISKFKAARKQGAREANLISGERPDRFHAIRAKFDIWGFNNYVEYLYTISELAFLEGLLVNLNVGYLSLNEMKHLQDIVATLEISLEIASAKMARNDIHKFSPSKGPDIRAKFLENAGSLNFPVNTGILIGIGESPEDRIRTLNKIRDIHEEYSNIQLVKINIFQPMNGVNLPKVEALSEHAVVETVSLAREILPSEVDITVPINLYTDVIGLIEHGVTDLGQIRTTSKDGIFKHKPFLAIEEYEAMLEEKGYQLQKRLPIKNEFVISQKYSKKLGQFLDKYKAKIKEQQKEDKFVLTF